MAQEGRAALLLEALAAGATLDGLALLAGVADQLRPDSRVLQLRLAELPACARLGAGSPELSHVSRAIEPQF